jgi:hypothetical protein
MTKHRHNVEPSAHWFGIPGLRISFNNGQEGDYLGLVYLNDILILELQLQHLQPMQPIRFD